MPSPSSQFRVLSDTPPSDVPPTKPLPDIPDTPEPMPAPGDPPPRHPL